MGKINERIINFALVLFLLLDNLIQMPSTTAHKNKKILTANELADFFESLDEATRKLVIKCLHINGENGESYTDKQKLDQLRTALK